MPYITGIIGGVEVRGLWVKWCVDVHFKQVNLLTVTTLFFGMRKTWAGVQLS